MSVLTGVATQAHFEPYGNISCPQCSECQLAPARSEYLDEGYRALRQRIKQQELLAELGVLALQGTTFMDMLQHGVRITAEGLKAEYCKVLEYIPAENRLLVRAGVGWEEGVVGSASVGADLESPSGYALRTGKPVISNHLENERRFRTPGVASRAWCSSRGYNDWDLPVPAIGKIHSHLATQRSLRADRKCVADDEHPDHQHRIDRRPPNLRIEGR